MSKGSFSRIAVSRLPWAIFALASLASAQLDTNMRQWAISRGIVIGAAVTFPGGNNVANRPAYDSVLKTDFNGMVPENAMKFQNLFTGRERGDYNWGPADDVADFAQANGLKLRGHTLVWHSQTAGWFNDLTGSATSRDTTLKIMKQHIDSVAGRYKGKIYEWDVVNEAIAQNGAPSPNLRNEAASRWHNRIGPDYIDSAFVFARRVDTTAKLFYNDFGGEFMNDASANSKSKNVYDLVKGLKDRGIPIHGVGLQCHFNLGQIDTAAMGANMRRLAALGLDISLTEIDIQVANNGTPTSAQLQTQKENYKAVMALCLSVSACKSFFVWGLNDNQSWRRPQASTAPLLYSGAGETLARKPAYFGVVEAIKEANGGPVALASPEAFARPAAAPSLRRSSRGTVGVTDARGDLRDLRGRTTLPASVLRAMQP
jgi:endo-1,4-beta-xylanase